MSAFEPVFQITALVSKALMSIEVDRQAIVDLPFTAQLLESLRESARLLSTHYSTQIEGNRLTGAQVREVIEGRGRFPGRERDEAEVRNYFRALEYIDEAAKAQIAVTKELIQCIHGLTFYGRAVPTPYRDGQNVIRDAESGGIVYLPPEAKDVPVLMSQFIDWINEAVSIDELPIPIIAAIAHYQFATIHPYYDGNGRSARLLTTFILHRYGYGLKGIYTLEAYYARQLSAYYQALTIGESHNYYVANREKADITPFVDYFIKGMAEAFSIVRQKASTEKSLGRGDQTNLLRNLSALQRQALELFKAQTSIASIDLSRHFKVSSRQALRYCTRWIEEGFFEVTDSGKRNRRYRLSPTFEGLFKNEL
jgi:Fic family protein